MTTNGDPLISDHHKNLDQKYPLVSEGIGLSSIHIDANKLIPHLVWHTPFDIRLHLLKILLPPYA